MTIDGAGSMSRGGGPTFPMLLTLLFIGLKLGGVIAWSWVWVLAPIWIPLVIALGCFLIAGLIGLIILISAGPART